MGTRTLLISLGLSALISNSFAFNGFGQDVDTYIEEASIRYQISKEMLRGLVKMENGWNNNISPTGATGVGQFTFKTWNWLATTDDGKTIGMKPITSMTRGTFADPRRNKRVNTLATGLLAHWHREQFLLRNIAVTDANLYMAHNIGLEGFHRAVLGRSTYSDIKNMQRNGMKHWMKVKDFIVYQKSRYYSHKQIANTRTKQSTLNVSIASTNKKIADKPKSETAKKSPTLRWIQPDDRQIVWINPVSSL